MCVGFTLLSVTVWWFILGQAPHRADNGTIALLLVAALVLMGGGAFGVWHYGVKNAIQNFGLILIVGGGVGLYLSFDGEKPSSSPGGGFEGFLDLLARIFGSLFIASVGVIVAGVLILLGVYLYNRLKKPS
jgi:hypothetical protein